MTSSGMPPRWQAVLDQKPVPLRKHLLGEVARLLAGELSRWPLDPAIGADTPRPPQVLFTEALELARLELTHEVEAFDDYFRNERYAERGLNRTDRAALLLVTRWLVEHLCDLGEHTAGRVTRAEMVECLAEMRSRLPTDR